MGSQLEPVDNRLWQELTGQQKVTTSASEHYESVLQTNTFMNGLRTGGAANGYFCDGIVVRSGEPFANGKNWLWCRFSQRD